MKYLKVINALFLVLGTMMALVNEDSKPCLWRGGKIINEGHTMKDVIGALKTENTV